MLPINSDEIQKWRVEVDNAERFREEQLGRFERGNKTKAGENVDYFDFGIPERLIRESGLDWAMGLFNVIHVITQNVIPTLYYKNPYVLALPKRRNPEDESSAPFAGGILNYYHKELYLKRVNKKTVFNAYVIGLGVSKMGYTTKFGTTPTEETTEKEKREREKAKKKSLLEKLGLKKPKEEEIKYNPDRNEYIRSESPFTIDVSPFQFGMDPRATEIENAEYVYEIVYKRLVDVKKDSTYSNTAELEGDYVEGVIEKDIPQTQIDSFKTVKLAEVFYKTDDGLNRLVLAMEGKRSKALLHEKFIYNIDGFPYELLFFNKHPHRLYPVSDIEKIKELQDRITQSLENILEQMDKYVPKLFVDETGLTEGGMRTLKSPVIGAIVYTNKNPGEVVKEAMFTQLKADLIVFIDKLMEIVTLMTGLTKAQLLGLTSAETATEAQIGQAGQNLRLADKFDSVTDFLSRQSRKLWQIIRQFVDLEEISLILGEEIVDGQTGMVKYSWMPEIDGPMAEKLSKGEYRFEIEVGATEKPDLPILRKQVENFVNILGGKGVLEAIAAQGYKIELVEIIKEYLQLFPNMFKNTGRIIKPIQQPMPGMAPGGPGGPAPGQGVAPQQLQQNPPTPADIISETGGEKGGQIPLA